MKRPPLALAILLVSASTAFAQIPGGPGAEGQTGALMAEAARRLLGSLDDAQRAKASFAFDDAERLNWHWIPRPRKGLPVKEMTPYQRPIAFALLDAGLSDKGALAAGTTMSYEEIIRAQEKGSGPLRDPELYYVSVFGTPGQGKWGWRWEGHHLSLNFTLDGSKIVAITPFMFGSNPAKVASGPNKGLRNLAAIQDPIYELVASLSPEQLKAATVSMDVPNVPSSPDADAAKPLPEGKDGLDIDDLTDAQKEHLKDAAVAYLALFPDEAARALMEGLHSSEGRRTFAWYGPADPSKPHAFRLQGPGAMIDFNNFQDDGNHIHTFFRVFHDDFGKSAR